MRIETQDLRIFVAVAEELNFHRAAERVGMVQPAVSRHIRDLELTIGTPLLIRTTRHVELTAAGKAFLVEARAILSQLEQAALAARRAADGSEGELVIGYMDFAVHRLLPDLLASVRRHEPGIRITLVYMPTGQQREALIERRIDFGIMIGAMAGPIVGHRLLAEEPMLVVLPGRHRFARRKEIAVEDLDAEDLVLGGDADWAAFRTIVAEDFAQSGRAPRIVQEASSAAALFGLVAAGFGLTLYAGRPERYLSGGLVTRPLANCRAVPIAMCWRQDQKVPLVQRLLRASGLG